MTTRPLRLGGVPEHFNLPWHLALESGSLADLELLWEDQHGGTGEMIANLAEGRLDVASILTEGTLKAIAEGLAVTVMQVYVRSPLQWGVFVPGQSRFQHESELDGAGIAISRFGSGSHLMAYLNAERNGWTLSDDQFVVVGTLDGAVEAFAAGRADLFLWDRFMTSPLVTNGSFRQLGIQETPWPSFVIAARNDIVTGRATNLGRIIDAVIMEAAGLMGRPDGPDLVADRYGISIRMAKAWFGSTDFAPRQAMDPDMAGNVLATLGRAGSS